jgi:histidinol-phosphate aminotransferase
MRTSIHRRALLKQGSLALAGLTFAGRFATAANEPFRKFAPGTSIRLTSNENPYGPCLPARKAMADAIVSSNRYPWDVTGKLLEQIGKHYNLSAEHVLVGAGSSEILGLTAQLAALSRGGNAVTANPTFPIWIPAAEKMGLQVIRVPLTRDKKHDLPSMLGKVNNETKLVYVCNPNNPTGTTLPSNDIKNFIDEVSRKSLVLLDEAYIEYCDQPSLAGMVASNKNLVIAKTFSKIYGLAGARIGYALAHPETINRLGALQPWQNAGASAVSLAAAMASLEDKDFVASAKENNRKVSTYTMNELKSLGFECIPSNTNFLYYSLGKYSGNWQEQMRTRNILIGRITEEDGRWTRTTVGTMEEMQAFIAAAKQIV